MTEIFTITKTDTFGGEPNYSEVHRKVIAVKDDASTRAIVREAKRAFGLSAYRGDTDEYGDQIDHRIRGANVMLQIEYCHTWDEDACEIETTDAQKIAVVRKYLDDWDGTKLEDYIGRLQPTIGCNGAVVLPWKGMFVCIERDGYAHT